MSGNYIVYTTQGTTEPGFKAEKSRFALLMCDEGAGHMGRPGLACQAIKAVKKKNGKKISVYTECSAARHG